MRVALLLLLALSGAAGAGFYAWRRLEAQPKPPPPAPAFLVVASASGRVAENEARVATPLEEALAKVPGVTRLRTRTTSTQVSIDVWAAPGTSLDLPNATVTPTNLPPETRWVVRAEKRPQVIGTVCGREDPRLTVWLDPLRLPPVHLDALDVARALKPAADVEALAASEIAPQVKLRDLANIELARPAPRCLAWAPEPVFAVTLRTGEMEGATRLGATSRLMLRAPAPPKLESVDPVLVTQELPSSVTLWFSPPLTAVQRTNVLQELARQPGVEVRHVDGLRRVRLVLTGDDRGLLHGIAGTVASTLRHVKGAELVVAPPEPEPYVGVKVDRERASALNIPTADVEALVALARNGTDYAGARVAVVLTEPEHIGALTIKDRRLAELVTMTLELEPTELLRQDLKPSVEVFAYGIDKKGVPMPALPAGVQLEMYEEL